MCLQHGVGVTLTVQCPKGIVGRIIGKGGETIKGLQRKYHVSIQIDQGGDPMNVTITGPKQTAEYCKQEIQSLVADPGPPFGGPGGSGLYLLLSFAVSLDVESCAVLMELLCL